MLFESLVFGGFVGSLVDYWLGRAGVKDSLRLIISVATGVIVAVLVDNGRVSYF